MKRLTLLSFLLAVAEGCGADVLDPGATPIVPEPVTTEPVTTGPVATEPVTSTNGALTGLPCDVRGVLQAHCARCHAGHTYVIPFASRDDLLAAFVGGTTWGERVAVRMQQGEMPPYPFPQPSAADRDVVLAWVGAGMPAGACSALTVPSAP